MNFPLTLGCEKRRWTVGVDGATMWTEWGQADGVIQRSERVYTEGKQGRSAEQQAVFEAEASARKKARMGFAPLDAAAAPRPRDDPDAPPLPMLATDWTKVKRPERLLEGYILQPKLDGIRCVADTKTGRLFSRTGKELHGLGHIGEALVLAGEVARPPGRCVDGEIYKHGASFQGIVGAARRTVNMDPEESRCLELHVFDVVKDAPAEARLEQLSSWLIAAQGLTTPGRLASIQFVHMEPGHPCDTIGQLRAAIDVAVARFEAEGYEGAIARAASGAYAKNKRSLDLVKAKRFRQEEFRVKGLEERAKQPGVVATVRCITGTGQEFGATPECTHAEKKAMWQRRAEYLDGRWFATVRFQELSDGGVPRFPVCAGLRHCDDV
jgi:DNA ligase-1